MLPIIESILLHVSSQDLLDGIADAPSFVADPIHPDTFYVQHALGVDAVYVRPWISALGDEEVLPPSEVTRLIDSSVLVLPFNDRLLAE